MTIIPSSSCAAGSASSSCGQVGNPGQAPEFCRPHSLLIFPEGAEQWHVVYGPGVRTGIE